MKNLLFGILTLGLLLGISALAVSPELTDFFVDEEKVAAINESTGTNAKEMNPDTILNQTGSDWEALSYKERMAFVLTLVKGLESRDMGISDPNEMLSQIDTYYESHPKEDTIEKAVMTILTEKWTSD